jgi:hypothetical protein
LPAFSVARSIADQQMNGRAGQLAIKVTSALVMSIYRCAKRLA